MQPDREVRTPPPLPRIPVTRRPRWGRRVCIVLVLLLAALLAFGVYLDRHLRRTAALPADSVTSAAGTNWLIVGSDSREGLSTADEERLATGDAAGARTDTIMLLHEGGSGTVLVSLPRDSYLPIRGHGSDKLNAAFAYGGPQLLVSTVEQATGLHVDHYAEIGFGGFVGAVDAVGGVDLCVPESIKDPKAGLDITKGCQELDGKTALGYVRSRATAGSDFDRIVRQRAFLSALIAKATGPTTIFDPFRSVPLASAITGTITVDQSDHIWNFLGLALAMRGVSGGNGVATTVPVGSTGDVGGQSVVRWDKKRAAALFTSLARDENPAASSLGP